LTERLLGTANYWAFQLDADDKELRKALEGAEPDGMRGESQPQFFLTTIMAALGSVTSLDGGQERARKDKEAADKLALENAQTRGEVGLISEIAERLGGHIDRCCSRLEQIPDALGQFCEPRIAAVVIPECRRLIHEARTELATDLATLGAAASGPVDTSAEPDSESVGGQQPAPVERKQRRARTVAN